MKHPHPSGHPVRQYPVKKSQSIWRCPLEGAATPRLRQKPQNHVQADAIGFQQVYPIPEEYHAPGFIDFAKLK